MKIFDTEIKEVKVILPNIFKDERGYFFESFNEREFKEKVFNTTFLQDHETISKYGVIRGFHYQLYPHCQSRLVRVISGNVLNVVLDMRIGAPTFGKHISLEISGESHKQLFIPRGFAHAYLVLSESATVQIKSDNYFDPESERGVNWIDFELNIDWKILKSNIIASKKDNDRPLFKYAFLFKYNTNLYI